MFFRRQIIVTGQIVDDQLDVYAYRGKRPVGHAYCGINGSRAHLFDIVVTNAQLRRRGIGSMMLRHLLCVTDAAGIAEVWGSVVMVEDLNSLLRWYAWHGFVISDRDDECLESAVHKVTRKVIRGTTAPTAARLLLAP